MTFFKFKIDKNWRDFSQTIVNIVNYLNGTTTCKKNKNKIVFILNVFASV